MNGNLTKSSFGIVPEPAMILTKVAERIAVQVPAVRRVAKRAEVGVMGRGNEHPAPRQKHAVKLLHRGHHVGYVLDNMTGAQLNKRSVAKGIRKTVQIDYYVSAGAWVAIDADRPWVLIDSAPYVEDPPWLICRRHSSSV